jgi:SAM-dependent methyltransferase
MKNLLKYEARKNQNGVPVFVDDYQHNEVKSHNSKKSRLKTVIKKILFAPHHSMYGDLSASYGESKELITLLKKIPAQGAVVNIGSLSKNLKELHPNVINLDICYYPNVDIVADVCNLPFKDESIDVIIFKNVLEHVKDPTKALSEIKRVLKKNGYLYVKIPFLQPFHAVPHDYQRYSESGFKELFKDYKELDFGISVGGGSMVAWILREYLAILFSFGNKKLYSLGLHFWGWLTFWIKYTDLFLKKNRLGSNIASAFYGIYQK